MKAQLLFCGFLPGVTAAILMAQPGYAASFAIGNFDSKKIKLLADDNFRIGESSNFNVGFNSSLPNDVGFPLFANNASITSIAISGQSESMYHPAYMPGSVLVRALSSQTTIKDRSKKDSNVLINTLKNKNVQPQGEELENKGEQSFISGINGRQKPSQPINVKQIETGNSTAAVLTKPIVGGVNQKNCQYPQSEKPNSFSGNTRIGELCQQKNSHLPKMKLAQGETNNNRTIQLPSKKYAPSPNPLLFPTKPEEVKLRENQVVSLAEALEIARRNNTDLQLALLQLEASQAALREQQASLFPTLNLNTSITRQQSSGNQLSVELNNLGLPEAFQSPADSPNTLFNSDVQLNYSLYTSGARTARIREAEEQVRAGELTVEQRSEEIRLNVTTQYYNLQQTDQSVRIAESAVTNAQKSLEDAQALERAGVGTKFDVLRSQVNLANAQQQLTNARSSQQVEQRRFALLLNLPQTVNLRAVPEVKLAGLWEQSLEETIILAYQNRPELQQELIQREINEQRRRLALSQKGPQVSLLASYDLLDQFNDGIAVTDGYSLGVRASLNLFDGGASRAQASQAKSNIEAAETRFQAQRDRIRFEVEQFYAELGSNLKNVQTARTALEQANEALRLARLRFQAGVGTQTDVINSENDLTRAEGNRINAILDYNRALANLERAVTQRSQPFRR